MRREEEEGGGMEREGKGGGERRREGEGGLLGMLSFPGIPLSKEQLEKSVHGQLCLSISDIILCGFIHLTHDKKFLFFLLFEHFPSLVRKFGHMSGSN